MVVHFKRYFINKLTFSNALYASAATRFFSDSSKLCHFDCVSSSFLFLLSCCRGGGGGEGAVVFRKKLAVGLDPPKALDINAE